MDLGPFLFDVAGIHLFYQSYWGHVLRKCTHGAHSAAEGTREEEGVDLGFNVPV